MGKAACLGVLVWIVCQSTVGIAQEGAIATEGGNDRDAIVTAIVAHYGKIRSLVFSEECTVTSDDPRNIPVHGKTTVNLEFRPDIPAQVSRYYQDVLTDEPENKLDKEGNVFAVPCNRRAAVAHDGQKMQELRAYMDGAKYRRNQVQGYLRSRYPPIADSWAWAVLPAGPDYMGNMLEDASVTGPKTWEGREVYVVEAYYGNPRNTDRPHNLTFYVDPEKDYAFCYAEWRRANGDVVTRTTIKGFKLVDEIWLPTEYEYLQYLPDRVNKWEGKIAYEKVNANLEAKDFRFEWPPGTSVHDEIAGAEYDIPRTEDAPVVVPQADLEEGDEEAGGAEGVLATASDVAVEEPVAAKDAGATGGEVAPRRGSALAVGAGVILAIGVVLLIRRFRKSAGN